MRIDTDSSAILKTLPNLPRYTSYPPANHFQSGAGAKLEGKFLAALAQAEKVSLYAHIPYCDRLCWFCGCHTKQTLSYAPVKSYIAVICRELELLRDQLRGKPRLSRVHLGGGSPSLLRAAELEMLRAALAQTFDMNQDCEISVEIDPSDETGGVISALAEFGMTRASIGVQDFDPEVQTAINRIQSYETTAAVVNSLRRHGIANINIDILYGLPYQDNARLLSTVAKVLSLHPQRIALFGYAHVPWAKPHQRLIPEAKLPDLPARLAQAQAAAKAIADGGYLPVGIDHFASPGDGLASAAANRTLHRNFQGYTDDQSDVLLGIGASSISRYPGGYLQNHVATARYSATIAEGRLAFDRGLALSDDDRLRGWVVERLMCDFEFARHELTLTFGETVVPLWHEALALAQGKLSGLAEIHQEIFRVQEGARPFTRYVASCFDAYLKASEFRYSMAV